MASGAGTPNDTIAGGYVVRDADNDVLSHATFSSDDESVVTVNDHGDGTFDGVLVGLGTANIVATKEDGNTESYEVTVAEGSPDASHSGFEGVTITAHDAPSN